VQEDLVADALVIRAETAHNVTVIHVDGEIDKYTVPALQQKFIDLVTTGK
jgi:anti-anti-sigma regulatory factor